MKRMDRRKSIKVLALGTLSAGVLFDACKLKETETNPSATKTSSASGGDIMPATRMKAEKEHEDKIQAETFFNPHETATITVLADIIIPQDKISGSASEAGVPEFIEFIVKEKPEFKVPMRGGLQWLDQQCYKRFNRPFTKCNKRQQIELVDLIAYPQRTADEMKQGASFFSLMRNLTASGFYTSQIGVKDLGYMGNTPNAWNGVPEDVLKQYGLTYTEQELKECANYN